MCDGRAAGGARTDVFVPNYWDPKRPQQKPDLGPRKTIRFVTGEDYPPFQFALPDGTPAGFNVDLARALCEELALTCTIQARVWETIVPSILAGEGDAAIASLSITADASRTVAFTAPYYRTPARFVAHGPATLDSATPESLTGKQVGVQAGTAHEAYLRAFFGGTIVKTFPTLVAARAALKSGNVDLLFADGIGSASWLDGPDAAGCCVFVGGPFTESHYFGEGAGIALRKDDPMLRRALDYALARVAAKGLYADLYLKYFPIGFY